MYADLRGNAAGGEEINNDNSTRDDSSSEIEIDEEAIIKYYFQRGFSYQEIRLLLNERHNYEMSYSTLLRRLKKYGLSKRGFFEREDADNNVERARQRIQEIINVPGSYAGYRTIWHTLKMEGLRVPRIIVEDILKDLDPDGSNLRKARRLRRRTYHNPGPNQSWLMDGYDKLKPFGFPIHGPIDGFSRRIL